MILPTEFTMANRQWTVELVSRAEMSKRMKYYERHHIRTDAEEDGDPTPPMGLCVPVHATILLNKDVHDGVPESLCHTLCHEIVHAMLFSDGLNDHDEAFVDRMGGYLHQLLETQEGDLVL